MIRYLTLSISITFLSWILGIFIGAFLVRTEFYRKNLTNLNFITSKSINKLIGIGAIKWVVKNTFFKFFNPNLKMKRKTDIGEADKLRKEMTSAEINHLIGFVAVVIFIIVVIFKGKYLLAMVMMIVNILMNLYPSLLQQENKRRIDKLRNLLTRSCSR
ncbi:MAG: hypothetical protein EOO96_23090 [Pedobacter sp.]|nr:MAG: hypothetical protein EOO96_23090 [Pedobacter sp.]